jgi:hypothetical protein
MFLAIVLTLAGIWMIARPDTVWVISESWKSSEGAEPSELYLWLTRFGGIICIVVGLAWIYTL